MRAITCAYLLLLAATAPWAANLLPNPGFETPTALGLRPASWSVEIHTSEGAEGEVSRDTVVKRSGAAGLRLDHTSEKAWVRSSLMNVPAERSSLYRASVWVRGNCHFLVLVYEFTADDKYLTHTVAGGDADDDWREVGGTFTTGDQAESFKVSLITDSRGSAWFDDATLELVASLPSLLVPTLERAPELDGKLDDECWGRAAEARLRYALSGEGAPADPPASALLARDDRTLYVAFTCDEPLADRLARGPAAAEASAWTQDRIEVFLQAQGGFCHFGVAASGATAGERFVETRSALYPNWHSPAATSRPDVAKPQFQAAVSAEGTTWTAELALPVAEVGPLQAAQPWRAQLCRARLVAGDEQYSTWSYVPGEKFAVPEQFGHLAFEGPVPGEAAVLSLRDRPAERPVIVPHPQKLTWAEGAFRLRDGLDIVLPAGAEGRQLTGPTQLAEDLGARYGLETRVVTNGPGEGPGVLVGWGERLAPGLKPATGLREEGYRLSIRPEGIEVVGADERGAFYGLQTLRQLVTADRDGPYLPGCAIEDWPATRWRGWHASSPRDEATLGDWRRVIDAWAALRYNLVVLEVNGRMKYDSYPDLGGGLTKDQMRELVQFARDRYLEVVPQLATFGHFDYVLRNPAYAHLGERLPQPDGTLKNSDWNYCPSNPEVYKLVFALMDELIEVFEPRYFHIGHDEASFSPIGVCPDCSRKKPWEVWAEDIVKLHDYLQGKGCRTMLWAEQFLVNRNGAGAYETARALPLIPRDLIQCHWEYSQAKEQPDIKLLMDEGFEVLGCPWYWPDNVYYMASEVHKYAALGFLGTTWYGLDSAVQQRAWLQGAWALGAENSWSPGLPDADSLDYSTLAVARRLLFDPRRKPGDRWITVDLGPYCNERTVAEDERTGWVGLGPDYDLRRLSPGVRWVSGVPVRLLDPAEGPNCLMLCDRDTAGKYPGRSWRVALGRRARALYFLHTTDLPAPRPRDMYDRNQPGAVGSYVITYSDGSQVEATLTYWREIDDWNSQLGPAQACGVIQDTTAKGAWVTLGLWRWENPHPDKTVTGVDFLSAEGKARPILLALTAEL